MFICDLLDEKWKLMESPVHYRVYLIDPRFRKNKLKYSEVKKGEKWLKKQAGDKWNTFEGLYKDYFLEKEPFDDSEWLLQVSDYPTEPYEILTRCVEYEYQYPPPNQLPQLQSQRPSAPMDILKQLQTYNNCCT